MDGGAFRIGFLLPETAKNHPEGSAFQRHAGLSDLLEAKLLFERAQLTGVEIEVGNEVKAFSGADLPDSFAISDLEPALELVQLRRIAALENVSQPRVRIFA